jgi:hypothetical protein
MSPQQDGTLDQLRRDFVTAAVLLGPDHARCLSY